MPTNSHTLDRDRAQAKPKLSVILITRNEAANIVSALESTRFADEWIVVDAGSTDETVAKARSWGATVYVHSDWPGFGPQKNRALSYATGEWVLSLDADERLTPQLAVEIQQVLVHPGADGYTIPRFSSFCGHFMRHGGWWPDRVLRLFRRDAGRFSDDLVHEGVRIMGEVRHLREPLIHYSYTSVESIIEKINAYSTAGAATLQRRKRHGGILRGLLHGLWAFLRAYFLRFGFLDGCYGFLAAVGGAETTFYRHVKRWYMDQQHASAGNAFESPAPPAPVAAQSTLDGDSAAA